MIGLFMQKEAHMIGLFMRGKIIRERARDCENERQGLVWKRERERERERWSFKGFGLGFHGELNPELSTTKKIQANVMIRRTHCNTLQCTATHCNCNCNTWQLTATRGNSLQHTATHCNTMQHSLRLSQYRAEPNVMTDDGQTATRCNTLQHTATHCNTHLGCCGMGLNQTS